MGPRLLFTFIMVICGALPVKASATESAKRIEWSGYFDSYYSYNFNRPAPVTPPTATSPSAAAIPVGNNTYRYYDNYHNQLTLNLIELTVKAQLEDVSLLTDLDFGTFADLNAATSSTNGTTVDETSKHVGQAVLTYRPASAPRFIFEIGKMYTHVGLETVKAKDNWQYSRSTLMAYGMPFWHTGVRLGYDLVPEKLSGSLYIYNGWNSIYENNSSKTIGVQIKYLPSSDVVLVYNFIGGPERSKNDGDWKVVHDLNGTITLLPKWQLAFNVLTGSEKNAVNNNTQNAEWYGGSVAAKYLVSEMSYISPRFEIYRDQGGHTLGASSQTVQSGTLTYGVKPSPSFEVRGEARYDSSNQSVFVDNNGMSNSQTTLLAALLFQI